MKIGKNKRNAQTTQSEQIAQEALSHKTKLNPTEMKLKIFGTSYKFKFLQWVPARRTLLKRGKLSNVHVVKNPGLRVTWPLQESRQVDMMEYILDLPEIKLLCAENFNVVLDPAIKVRVIDPIAAFNNSDNVFELIGVTLISSLRPIIASMTFDQIKNSHLERDPRVLDALSKLYRDEYVDENGVSHSYTTYGVQVTLMPFQKIDREEKMASVYSQVQESQQRVRIAQNDAEAKRLVEEVPQDVALRLAARYEAAGYTKEQAMNMVKTVALANSQANVIAVVGDGDSNVANAATLGAAFNAGGRNR